MLEEIQITWRSVLMFAACFCLLLVAIRLLTRPTERLANTMMALFLIAIVFAQTPQIIGFAGVYDIFPELGFFPFSTELYFGPLIYLHAFFLMDGRPAGKRWLLLLPGLVQTTYYSVIFWGIPDLSDRGVLYSAVQQPIVEPVETVLSVVLAVSCLFATYTLTRRYLAYLQETESAVPLFDPTWLKQLLYLSILAAGIYFVFSALTLIAGQMSYLAAYPFQLAIALIITWMGLDAASRTHIAFPKLPAEKNTAGSSSSAETDTRDWAEQGARVVDRLRKERLYLNPTLSLKMLARSMSSNESYVSKAINTGLQTNFNKLVNHLRIEYAKTQLQETSEPILAIALSAGFNSKATFNRAFKALAGQTPSQFRRDTHASRDTAVDNTQA